jgi:hypothetical protein
MKLKKIFLLLVLTLLFIGLSYATEVSNDTISQDSSISDATDEVVQSSNTPIKEVDNSVTDEKNTEKEIIKQNDYAVKAESSETSTLYDFSSLYESLTGGLSNSVTLDNDYESLGIGLSGMMNCSYDGFIATNISLDKIATAPYGENVSITGSLTTYGIPLMFTEVTVKFNDDIYTTKTNYLGKYNLTVQTDTIGTNNVTVSYHGNIIFSESTASTTFKVKYPTWIKIGKMANVEYGSTVKVLARLLYNGTTSLKYKTVNVTVNDKVYQVKSDGAGYIRLNYTVDSYDTQKISFKYAGSSLYLASSNSTTFKVKQPTWIKHASIGKVKMGDVAKIVGRVLYNGTNSVKYVPVNLTVDGNVYNLKTDGAGYFRLNYTTTKVGTFTFTSDFGGNNLYMASTNSTKFTVVKS